MNHEIRLASLTALNLIATMLTTWLIISTFGAGVLNDVFIASTTVSQIILTVLANAVTQAATPLLAAQRSDENQFRQSLAAVSAITFTAFVCISLTLYATQNHWAIALFPKLAEYDIEILHNLITISILGLVISGINSVQNAAYFAKGKFIKAEEIGCVANFISVTFLALTITDLGIYSAAYAVIIRPAVQLIAMYDGLTLGALRKPRISSARKFVQQARPLVFGNSYFKIDPAIDRHLLAGAESGALTIFSLVQQVYGAFSQIVHKALIGPILYEATSTDARHNGKQLRLLLKRKLYTVTVCIIISGLAVGVLGFNTNIIAYGIRTLNATQLQDLGWIAICLFGMFAGGLLGGITSSFFYALGDTRTPTVMSVATFTIYIPSKIIAFTAYGVYGLCISISAYLMINFWIMMVLLRRMHLGGTESSVTI